MNKPTKKPARNRPEQKVVESYVVRHPALGTLYEIDTSKTIAELSQSDSDSFLMIGKDGLLFRQSDRSDPYVFELTDAINQVKRTKQPIRISKHLMRRVAEQLETLIIPAAVMFIGPAFFIWKLIAAFFYSLFAMLINRFRREKLRYHQLFAVSCFALTPVAGIQIMNFGIPDFFFDLNLPIALGLTISYLAYALLATGLTSDRTSKA